MSDAAPHRANQRALGAFRAALYDYDPGRLQTALAYTAAAAAAGLCAAVFATDGEILAMLVERVRGGRTKGKLRVAAEKRAARRAESGQRRQKWPGGLPWLEGR